MSWQLYNSDYPLSDDGTTATGLDWSHYGIPARYDENREVVASTYTYINTDGVEATVNRVGPRKITISGMAADATGGTYTADGLINKLQEYRDSKQTFTFVCPEHPGGITVIVMDVQAPQDAARGISYGRSARTWALRLVEVN